MACLAAAAIRRGVDADDDGHGDDSPGRGKPGAELPVAERFPAARPNVRYEASRIGLSRCWFDESRSDVTKLDNTIP